MKPSARCARLVVGPLAAVAIAVTAGCAPYPATLPAGGVQALPAARPHGATTSSSGPAAGAGAMAARPAPVDTTPSPAALEVLAAIPEPLRPEERVPPPGNALPGQTPAGVSAADTAGGVAGTNEAAADSGAGDVPVPEPTLPLGQRPTVAADSTGQAPPAETPSAPGWSSGSGASSPRPAPSAPPAASGPQSAGAAADTCWRVQFVAPAEAGRAERFRSAAESVLLVPMVIEREKGLFKVRTRDCLGHAGADALRTRALQSGFAGAFRFRGTGR